MARKQFVPRVALIGVSGYAREHLNFLLRAHRQGRLQLTGAVVIAPGEEREQCDALAALGCPIYASHERLWEAQRGALDLAVIPTPIHLHVPMTLAALAAGANVLVEKPLTSDPDAVPRLIEAEAQAGRFVAVGFQDLYSAGVHALKRLLVERRLGELRLLKTCGLWPRNDAYYRRNDWAGRQYLGAEPVFDSPLNNAFAHHLNLLLFLAGTRFETSASITGVEAELFRARAIETFDTAAVRLRTSGPERLVMLASHSSREECAPEIVVECTAGQAVWNMNTGLRVSDRHGALIAERAGRDNPRAMADMYDHVLRRLEAPDEFVCSLSLAAVHVAGIAAIHRAAAIVDVPAEACLAIEIAGGPHTAIRDLELYFRRAFATGQLLSEVGCPWARPALAAPAKSGRL